MGNTIVFTNQKGGVGKTTTAVNIGSYLAAAGKKVLLVDFDSQGNLSSAVGADAQRPGVYEALTGQIPVADAIQDTRQDGLKVLPSSINLTGATIELVDQTDRDFYLKNTLAQVKSDFDYILIDSPPSLGILTLNGLAAADHVIVPMQCEYFALEGLTNLLQTIKRVQKSVNPHLKIGGIVFTMYDSRTRLANEVVQEVTSYFKDKVFQTIIPRNVRLSEAPSHGLPINLYDMSCVGAKCYQSLAEEVINRVH